MTTATLPLPETEIFHKDYLSEIRNLDNGLKNCFEERIRIDGTLTRKLVSFQGNKTHPSYRWYKYKEAFSASLITYLLKKHSITKGKVLDPFAGTGTALFSTSEHGYEADGIELLPIGQQIIKNRKFTTFEISVDDIAVLKRWKSEKPWKEISEKENINALRITEGAYSRETELEIGKYLFLIKKEKQHLSNLLFFSLLCVLESISYTRKDGQYLRWDHRANRRKRHNSFNKGKIFSFEEAITKKISEIIYDLETEKEKDFFENKNPVARGKVNLFEGSCLNLLPCFESLQYNVIITSPPYCNRYDYTRTYALEHAMLGISEEELISLRQQMISCTVENREKKLIKMNSNWEPAIKACNENNLLQKILEYLEHKKTNRELNNNGIPRMVRGYFYEMSCIIQECFRVLNKGGVMFMVNDNVRYAGASISVDLIMSSIAENLGFTVKNILVLPQGKGNSSQQMGEHGREALRKCVYVWKK